MHNRQRAVAPQFDQNKLIVAPRGYGIWDKITTQSKYYAMSLPTDVRVEQKGVIENNKGKQQWMPRPGYSNVIEIYTLECIIWLQGEDLDTSL